MIWILDPEQPGESRGTMSAIGPFVSVIAAEEYLRKDARETFLDADKSCRELSGEEWAKPVHIVQFIKTVQQCPEVRVSVRLKDIPNK